MNILVVCRDLPYPPNAGYRIRTYNLLKRLARRHTVSLLCYDVDGSGAGAEGVAPFCAAVELVQVPKLSRARQIPQALGLLLRGEPLSARYVQSEAMERAIARAVQTGAVDLIHFDDPYITTNCPKSHWLTLKKTVTYHDIDSQKYARLCRLEPSPAKRAMLELDLSLVRRMEKSMLRNADLNIVMSEVDRDSLLAHGIDGSIAIVPNGVDVDRFPFQKPEATDLLSYFGTMDYLPNEDAALYFHREILPLLAEERPQARFCIVGRRPGARLREAVGSDPRVEVTGEVNDVVPYYRRSAVAVVPLRAGGGTRLKILEAMALGCPVVSTSIGAEGLNVTHGENILLADTPESFARATLQLMGDAALRETMSIKARRFVEEQYSWEGIAEELSRRYSALAGAAAQGDPP
jgi:polysaccharide biosynthesis protein PslH